MAGWMNSYASRSIFKKGSSQTSMKKIGEPLHNKQEELMTLISRKGLLKDSHQQQPRILGMQTTLTVIKN